MHQTTETEQLKNTYFNPAVAWNNLSKLGVTLLYLPHKWGLEAAPFTTTEQ